MNDPIAACSCDSESTRKFAELTICVACLQPLQDHDVIIESRSDLDLARFEIAVAVIDERYFARARMQDARSRNDKLSAERNRHADVDEHARLEREPRIAEDEAHRTVRVVGSTCGRI